MLSSERRAVGLVVVAFAAAYSLFGLFRHWHFDSSAFDLGIFDQAIWHMSRFEAPASTISGFSNILGDHFYPVLGLFAPLYWIAPRAETLIVAQAVLLAASIVPVYLFARDPSTPLGASRLPHRQAMALAAAYGLYWGLQRTMEFDVHEMAFAPLAIACLILGMDRRRWTLFGISAVSLIFIKEDLIPLLAGAGILLMIRGRSTGLGAGERRLGAAVAAGSAIAFVLVVAVIIPSFHDTSAYNQVSAFREVLDAPWRIPIVLVTPPGKLLTLLMWFAPFALLSLRSPYAILALPLIAERLLSSSPNHWSLLYHYSAPMAPIVAMSAVDGLARIRGASLISLARANPIGFAPRTLLIASVVLLCALLPGGLPLWDLFKPSHYAATRSVLTGRTLISMVPPEASVVAQAALVPHLSQRHDIFMLQAGAPDADYVIAAAGLSPWPAAGFGELRTLLEERKARGYRVIREMDGWTLLRRNGAGGS